VTSRSRPTRARDDAPGSGRSLPRRLLLLRRVRRLRQVLSAGLRGQGDGISRSRTPNLNFTSWFAPGSGLEAGPVSTRGLPMLLRPLRLRLRVRKPPNRPGPITDRGLRILLLSDVYFPRVNGVSTSILSFREALKALGHQVVLIAPDYGEPDAYEPDGDIWRIPARSLPFDREDRAMNWRRLFRLMPQIRAYRFDLVHIQTPAIAHYAGLIIARRLGLPSVETYHTLFEEYLANYIPWLPEGVLRFLARRFARSQGNSVDGLIAPSRPTAELLQRYGVRQPIDILPTGIDLGPFVRQTSPEGVAGLKARLGIRPEQPVLSFVGRVAIEKNISLLLDMLAALKRMQPEVILLIAGHGPAEAELRAQAERLEISANLRWLGNLPRDGALQDCFRAGDLFVFASKTETQGLVLLEAMSLGVPVVALAERGTREVLCEGEGARIAPDDPQGFAAVVHALLSDPEQRSEVKQRGLQWVQRWEEQAVAARLVAVYQRLLTPEREQQAAVETALSNTAADNPQPEADADPAAR